MPVKRVYASTRSLFSAQPVLVRYAAACLCPPPTLFQREFVLEAMRLRPPGHTIRKLLPLCFALVLSGAGGCVPIRATPSVSPSPAVFSGTVARGAVYTHTLSATLLFGLVPYGQDWEIWIGEPGQPDVNFAAALTPPLHGVNARQIEGWHFRNRDNSGPNAPGTQNVNAPQAVRPFCFAVDAAGAHRATAWVQQRLAGGAPPGASFDFATASGVLTITHLALGNLAVGERAWIEQMDFAVALDWAAPCIPF